jgi:hypothetical protein
MPQKRAKDLSRRDLETIVNAVQVILWFDEHGYADQDKEWTPATLEEIAEVLEMAGLKPGQGGGTP